MVSSDCDWAAELLQRRRESYATFTPLLWRPSGVAVAQEAALLKQQVGLDDVVALRTAHALVVAQLRGNDCFVDDFVVDDEGFWWSEGAELLRAAWEGLRAHGATSARVVSAKKDSLKNEMLVGAGLRVSEQWWVKPVEPAGPAETGAVNGEGFGALIGPPPPVYDLGGPVMFVRYLGPSVVPGDIEARASRSGAVLVVVPQHPGRGREADLAAAGFEVASQWYVGKPGAPAA